MPTETAVLTPDALLDLPTLAEGKHYELSDGELIGDHLKTGQRS